MTDSVSTRPEPKAAGSRRGWTRRFAGTLLALLLLAVLSGCADSDSQRQFANDPQATEDIVGQSAEPAATRVVPPTALPATPLPVANLVSVRGETTTLVVQNGNELIALSTSTGAAKRVFSSSSEQIAAFDATQATGRVAVLTVDNKNGVMRVHFVGFDGKAAGQAELSPVGTPEAGGGGIDTVVWSPAGDRVLVTLANGGIVEVAVDGSKRTILSAARAPSPRSVAWSPSGNAIAYVDAGPDHSATGLYVGSLEALPLDPVTVIRPIPGRSRQIQEIAWAGGSVGVVYSERAPDGDLSLGGDLFAVPAAGGSPRLIGTAGGVSQVGAVGKFVVSPNAEAVAYSILNPGNDGPIAAELVVRQIDGTSSVQLPVPDGGAVSGIAWTGSGVVWAVSVGERIDLYRAAPDGSAIAIATVPTAASPVASSVAPASPVAPSASPVASPVG